MRKISEWTGACLPVAKGFENHIAESGSSSQVGDGGFGNATNSVGRAVTGLAVALLLIAAVSHATWNLILKRVEQGSGGPVFVWLFGTVSTLLYAPLTIYVAFRQAGPQGQPGHPSSPGSGGLWVLIVSGIVHLSYYLLLQHGYRRADFSLVYPLARGTGPLLATAGAVALLGERPSAVALFGALLVSGSIYLLSGGSDRSRGTQKGLGIGLLIGVNIAAYTLWDKYAVSHVMLAPILLDRGANTVTMLLLTPYAIRQWKTVKAVWRANRRAVLAVAALSPLSYILVLQALTFTPASYIAPAREVSILFGTLMGMRLLGEGVSRKRLTGAVGMVVALAALALG